MSFTPANEGNGSSGLSVAPGTFFYSCTAIHAHHAGTLATTDGTFESLSVATGGTLHEYVLKKARADLSEAGLNLPEDVMKIHIIALNRL